MQYSEIFEKVPGFDWGVFAREMGLQITEDDMFYRVRLAHRRQQKIFDTMVNKWEKEGTKAYIAPEEFEDHINMYDYCKLYYMTPEYEELEDDLKKLVQDHLRERRDMVAEEQAAAQQAAAPQQA